MGRRPHDFVDRGRLRSICNRQYALPARPGRFSGSGVFGARCVSEPGCLSAEPVALRDAFLYGSGWGTSAGLAGHYLRLRISGQVQPFLPKPPDPDRTGAAPATLCCRGTPGAAALAVPVGTGDRFYGRPGAGKSPEGTGRPRSGRFPGPAADWRATQRHYLGTRAGLRAGPVRTGRTAGRRVPADSPIS